MRSEEDIFQTVFLKYVLHSEPFESEAHKKAWIIRVTINACKDLLKSFFRTKTVPLDQVGKFPAGTLGAGMTFLKLFCLYLPNTKMWFISTTMKSTVLWKLAASWKKSEHCLYTSGPARTLLKERLEGGTQIE